MDRPPIKKQSLPPQIRTLIDTNALFVVNHSGGKDSQAMLITLMDIVPREQLVIVHADLPEVDWDGIHEHIEATSFGLPVYYTQANVTLLDLIKQRGMFPSSKVRYCTSTLKREPLAKLIRRLCDERGHSAVVNCMGMRAQESDERRVKPAFKVGAKRVNTKKRPWFEWLPIHAMREDEVFDTIGQAGQWPLWVYQAGMSRASCCFCVFARKSDLRTARELKPELYHCYAALERKLDHTLRMPDEKTGKRQFLDELLAGDDDEDKYLAA